MRSDFPPDGAGGGWLAGIRVYLHPRVLAMLFLGFSAGLPFPLVFATLTAWLMTANVSMAEIGMFAWVGVLYSLKFLWAPLVDWIKIPILTRWLGRRRSWMLVAQVGVAGSLVALSGSDPSTDLGRVAWLALATAFSRPRRIFLSMPTVSKPSPRVFRALWRQAINSDIGWHY